MVGKSPNGTVKLGELDAQHIESTRIAYNSKEDNTYDLAHVQDV